MARPRKTGLDYYNRSTVLSDAEEDIVYEFGATGIGVWFLLQMEIFRSENAILDSSDVLRRRKLAKLANMGVSKWELLVKSFVALGLLDKTAFKRWQLTSADLQNEYKKAAIAREKGRKRFFDSYSAKKGGLSPVITEGSTVLSNSSELLGENPPKPPQGGSGEDGFLNGSEPKAKTRKSRTDPPKPNGTAGKSAVGGVTPRRRRRGSSTDKPELTEEERQQQIAESKRRFVEGKNPPKGFKP